MSTHHVSIQVYGVACAGHSVESGLARLTGVTAVYVNTATELAEIDFDDARITVEQLCQGIRRCGFRAGTPSVVPDGAHRSHPSAE